MATVATQTPEPTVESFKKMTVNGEASKFPNSFPELNPIDAYREHVATELAKITGVDAQIIYPVIQWTQTLDKGDLVLPVPALRIKGEKPNDLAAKWANEVGGLLESLAHISQKETADF